MKATVVDLRYKMKKVLKALDRNEEITVLYHGKAKGVIVPVERDHKKIKDHPFFGMSSKETVSVPDTLKDLRKPRYAV